MGTAYIIHKRSITRGDEEIDLLEYGVFGSYFSALNVIRSIVDILKDELEDCYSCTYKIISEFIDGEHPYEYDLITIQPDYEKDDPEDIDFEDYREMVELCVKPIKYTE